MIGQISEICPSAWVHLWPEAPVEGYVFDPVRGVGIRPLDQDLDEVFGPACARAGVELFLSRLHDHPDPALEARSSRTSASSGNPVLDVPPRPRGGRGRLPWRRTLRWPEGRNAWDPERGLVRLELPDGAVLGAR